MPLPLAGVAGCCDARSVAATFVASTGRDERGIAAPFCRCAPGAPTTLSAGAEFCTAAAMGAEDCVAPAVPVGVAVSTTATPLGAASRFTFFMFDTYSGGGAAGTGGALAACAFALAGLFGSPGLPFAGFEGSPAVPAAPVLDAAVPIAAAEATGVPFGVTCPVCAA